MYFAAQMAEGDAQEVNRVLVLGSTPEFVNQLMMHPNLASMVDQHLQKVVLGRSQFHLAIADKHLPAAQIDSEIIHFKNVTLCRAYAAQGCAHAR